MKKKEAKSGAQNTTGPRGKVKTTLNRAKKEGNPTLEKNSQKESHRKSKRTTRGRVQKVAVKVVDKSGEKYQKES